MRVMQELGIIEDAPAGLKVYVDYHSNATQKANDMCKRKRFGEYDTNPRMDDVVLKQCDLWQASFGNQVGVSSGRIRFGGARCCILKSLQHLYASLTTLLPCFGSRKSVLRINASRLLALQMSLTGKLRVCTLRSPS